MFRVAVYCTKKVYIDNLFYSINSYKQHSSDSNLSFSLFSSFEAFKNTLEVEQPFDIYLLDASTNDRDMIQFIKFQEKDSINPVIILFIKEEEKLLQTRLDYQNTKVLLLSDTVGIADALEDAVHQLKNNVSKPNLIKVKTKKGYVTIPYSDIIYIEYLQKQLTFHLSQNREVTTQTIRVPMEEKLSELMEDKRFIRVHRAFIINTEKAINLDQNNFLMEDGSFIPLSKQRSNVVLDTWQKVINRHSPSLTHLNASVQFCEIYAEQLELLKKQPFPQCVIRVDITKNNKPFDFVFMFVNDELCKLEGKSKHELLGASFYDVFANADPKWLSYYWDTAYNGKAQVFESYSREIDKKLKFVCYQFKLGYCCCILLELDNSGNVIFNPNKD